MDIGERFSYQTHVFVCTKCKKCKNNENLLSDDSAQNFRKHLKKLAKEKFKKDEVRINASGCLSLCENGINAVLYPQNIWISNLKEGEEEKVLNIIENVVEKKKESRI